MRSAVLRSAGLVAGSLILVVSGTGAAGAVPGNRGASARATPPSTRAPGAAGEVGRWTVAPVGSGSWRLTWRSPTPLPVTDAAARVRHAGSLSAGVLGADGRTVSVVVSSATRPDPAGYDVLLGSRVLDRRGGDAPQAGTDRTSYPAPVRRTLAEDPGQPGTHAITTSDYQLDPVKLPGIRKLSEMVGHVVAPVDATDDSPLVLFLHGRHDACYQPSTKSPPVIEPSADPKVWACRSGQQPVPSLLGYDYVQRTLASQGYVTVSISADAINALDWQDPDGGAADRAALIRDHLRAWVDFVHDGTHPADLANVILIGHSRGGEGVNRASLNLPVDEGYHVAGQVLIGPTDFGFQADPAMPTVTLLPYCDGDVSDLQGQNFTDDGRDVTADPARDLAFHSSVLVMGADHNFFNSEWTPGISAAPSVDDWGGTHGTCGSDSPTRLSAGQQRKVGRTYLAGAVHLIADADTSVLPMFDGSPVSVPSAGNADVRSHAVGGGLVMARPGLEGSAGSHATAAVRLCTGVSDSTDAAACQKNVSSGRAPHWPSAYNAGVPLRQFLEVGWTKAGQRGGLSLAQPWDLTADRRLDLRTIVDPRRGPVRVAVSLTDADGDRAVVTPVGGGTLAPLPVGGYSLAKRWGQDLRVPLTGVGGVDLSRITEVGLVAKSVRGRVYVADVSATPSSGLSTTPTSAVPLFSLGTVRRLEGNGPDPVTVEVPWRVRGSLEHDATVRIVRPGKKAPQTLVIPAHTTSGVLPVTYRPNDQDDEGNRFLGLTAYAVSGIETDAYLGGVTIVDDDPTPSLTIASASRRVTAGRAATWTATLGAPVHYWAYAVVDPVRSGSGPQLRIGDLTKRFRERNIDPRLNPATPLYRSHASFFVQIRPNRTSTSLVLPTRRQHGVARSVALRFRAPQFDLSVVRTVKVVPAR